MSIQSLKYARLILLIVIPLLIIFKIRQLNKTSFSIDELKSQLSTLKTFINSNSTVGFYSNNESSELYFEVQYITTPQIVSHTITPDTLLVVQYQDKPIKVFAGYRTIVQTRYKGRTASLITRIK